jgi:hypothetical protein
MTKSFFQAVILMLAAVPVVSAQDIPPAPPPLPAETAPPIPPIPPASCPPSPEALLPLPPPAPSPSNQSWPQSTPLSLGTGSFLGLQALTGFQEPRASYSFGWAPNESVSNQPGTHLGVIQQTATVGAPVWRDDDNFLSVFARAHGESFFTNAVLPNSNRAFPDELWQVDVGAAYSHHFENGWTSGVAVSVGSASDELFHSTREMEIGANAFLIVPSGEHNAWIFTLMYSPTAELPFPIPGVAYLWQPSENLRINIGLPFQLFYRPIDDVTLEFSYMLVRTVHARATYHLTKQIGVFVGYDWSNESYFLVDRQETDERFFYYDQRVSTGVQAIVTQNFMVELSAGYLFDRFYFQGVSYSDRENDRVDVSPGLFIGFRGRFQW